MKGDRSSLKTNVAVVVLLFFLSIDAKATESLSCIDSAISSTRKHIECVSAHSAVRGIRPVFNRILARRASCPKCAPEMPRETNFHPLFKLKFLPVEIRANEFGGYFVTILFRKDPGYLYKIWAYPIGKSEVSLRGMWALKFGPEVTRITKELITSNQPWL